MFDRFQPVDWKALIAGTVVTFSSAIVGGAIISSFGTVSLQDFGVSTVPWSVRYAVSITYLLAAFPGAVVAGYLHSLSLRDAAYYGMGVTILGLVLPALGLLFLIFGFLAALGGIFGLIMGLYVMALLVPFLATTVLMSGIGGGVLGCLLRRRTTDVP